MTHENTTHPQPTTEDTEAYLISGLNASAPAAVRIGVRGLPIRRSGSRVAARVTATAVGLVAALGVLGGLGAATAAAAVPNPSVKAYCGRGYVTSEAPDPRTYGPSWDVAYGILVNQWTSSGWMYYTGRGGGAFGSDWSPPSSAVFSVPANRYYQVIVVEYWFYNDVYQDKRTVRATHYQISGTVYSPSDYCLT
jgi:hypothetical protein